MIIPSKLQCDHCGKELPAFPGEENIRNKSYCYISFSMTLKEYDRRQYDFCDYKCLMYYMEAHSVEQRPGVYVKGENE